MGGEVASIKLHYIDNNGNEKEIGKPIQFQGNFGFSIYDDDLKKHRKFEGEYIVENGKVYQMLDDNKRKEITELRELPMSVAYQITGMSNTEFDAETGNTQIKDYTFTAGDFRQAKKDSLSTSTINGESQSVCRAASVIGTAPEGSVTSSIYTENDRPTYSTTYRDKKHGWTNYTVSIWMNK